MTKKLDHSNDPIESSLEDAFQPRRYIEDGACFAFVQALELALAPINGLVAAEPLRAAMLFEVVLAGCHHKADDVDDSSASFAMFVKGVICRWIHARQQAGVDPAVTATTLLSWMDDDPYGFCSAIEEDICQAYDQPGLAAFEAAVRARYHASPVPLDHNGRRWGQVLRAIYLAQEDAAAYQNVAEKTGLAPEDCLALARLLACQQPGRGLEWVERGLLLESQTTYSGAGHHLKRLQGELLVKLGRTEQALELAWSEHVKHPSKHSLDNVLKLAPEEAQDKWREKALDAAQGTDLRSAMALFVEAEEWSRLVGLVGGVTDAALEKLSHHITEPAAEGLEESHPAIAARLWRAQAFRIVDAGKSKYYDAAIDNLDRAKQCYARAGMDLEWDRTVAAIRQAHFRKLGFMRDFEALTRGESQLRPSFLDSAKAKWRNRYNA